MIRYYCQYSYGGFKTFHINGEAHEELTQVVTAENSYGFPPLADLYFNQGGAKILYRFLDSQTLSLVVKEIPGHGLDTDNRPISCAVQFIGDAEDRGVMDRLTIHIANNLEKFEKAFADMFDLRGGLHFEGDQLVDIVRACGPECNYEGDSRLLHIREQKGTVLLFVPFSDNFGRDEKVTAKTLAELQLPNEAREEDKVIRLSELMTMQYLLQPVAVREKKADKPENGEDIDKLKSELEELKAENAHLRNTAAAANKELSALKEKDSNFLKTLYVVIAIVCAVFFCLVITKCYTLTWIFLAIITVVSSYKTYKLYKP
jgi:hypothetical protein